MRASQFHLSTTKETPAAAELVSHQLMLRAGMIRQIAAGLYTWMPLGLRVLRRAEAVIRDEMDRSGALELLMPMVQPGEVWRETGRWSAYGPELLRFTDRHERDFCLGPTHEEIITELFRREIRSHRQLPINLYQIQTKFRDEVRPRFGVMRAREFVMKDAYSFHLTEDSLVETYEAMVAAYRRIFERLGLDFRAVRADTGAMGGKLSHEFHVLASSGEDAIAYSTESDYAANVELAEAVPPSGARPEPSRPAERGQGPPSSAAERSSRVRIHLVRGSAEDIVALVLRADHTLNDLKASRLEAVAEPLESVSHEEAERKLGAPAETIDLARLATPIIADHAAARLADFACPAGTDGHWLGMNWGRDVDEPQTADLREVEAGDPSPDGRGRLEIARGIEVGHIFQLGDKYSADMDARVADENGREQLVTMGCYGIGVSRVIAAAIEQNHDDRGIIWPRALAPFDIALLPMNAAKSERVRETTEQLYSQLTDAGLEVLLDDRGLRPGVMFSDMELIGIPHRLVVGERGLESGSVEYQARGAETAETFAVESAADELRRRLKGDR